MATRADPPSFDGMKHITYAEKSLLVGDDAADTMLEYAALLTTHGRGDTVTLRALGADGDEVDATFLLAGGAPLMAETAGTQIPEPDNAEATAAMRARIRRLEEPEPVQPGDRDADAEAAADLDRFLLG
jgi:hypothetical protein